MPAFSPPEPSAPHGTLVIDRARVWTEPDEAPGSPERLLVRDGVIVARGDTPVPRDARTVDAEGRILTAGFVNCHVHLSEPLWQGAARTPAERLQAGLDDMFLARGFTSVLDLASRPRDTRALVRRIERRELRGPAILSAFSAIRPPRGLPYYVRSEIPLLLRPLLPSPGTPFGARAVVAAQALRGARLTKLFTGSYVGPAHVRHMGRRVARAAVAAAHRRGMPVLAHPSDARGILLAIEAGVDALAHLPDTAAGTEELLARAAAHGIRLVPTLAMFAETVSRDESYLAPLRAGLRAFRAAGGLVLFGTDVGYLRERDTAGEFEAMAACGMEPADLLRSLTSEAAAFLAREDIGRVAPGLRADLTLLDAREPTVAAFSRVHAVVRDGRVVWSAERGAFTP